MSDAALANQDDAADRPPGEPRVDDRAPDETPPGGSHGDAESNLPESAIAESTFLERSPFPDHKRPAPRSDALGDIEDIEIGGRQGIPVGRTSMLYVGLRIITWLTAVARLAAWLVFDRRKKERWGYRARRVVESLGGPAIVFARQFAMRIELMPIDFATELARLVDHADPMPLDQSFTEFKKYLHRDVEDVFEVFDPEVILTSSIDCVYQAVLRSGQKVAVRIMRPEAPSRIHHERIALQFLARLFALFLPSYKARLRSLHDELPYIESELLDYVKLARTHRLLRKQLKHWWLTKKFHVAGTHPEHCSKNVIVSEFIEGYWLHEVLGARENDDKDALRTLAAANIDPEVCAQRVFEFGLWSMLENVFALAAPRASQFGVLPGNALAVVQIGTVTTFGRHQKRVYAKLFERLLARDFEGMAELLIQSLFPLPLIDVYEFTKAVEKRLVLQLLAIENKDAPSEERSGTGLWLSFLQEVKRYEVVVPLELSRMIQSLCTFCELAFRLDPKLKLRKQIRRYRIRALRREAKDSARSFIQPNKGGGSRFTARPHELTETLDRARTFVEGTLEMVPLAFLASSKKFVFSVAQFLKMGFLLTKVTAVCLLISVSVNWIQGDDVDVWSQLWEVVRHPAYLVFVVVIFLLTARKIQYRLDDLD